MGIILPLSGPVASMGNAVKEGIDLYLQENAHLKADVVLEDSQYDGKTSISAFYKLASVDKVSLIVVWGNTPASAVAPVAERTKVPTIVITHMPLALNKKWVVSFGPKAQKVMGKINQYFNEASCNFVASLSVDLGNALESVEILNKMRGGHLLQHVFSTTEADFKNATVMLKRKSADCLLLFMLSEQANTFVGRLKSYKYSPKIVGGDVFDDYQFLQSALTNNLDVVFVDGAVTDKFRNEIQKKKGSFIYSVAIGHVVTKLAFEIAKTAPLAENFIANLKLEEDTDLPIEGLKLLHDEYYGWHFENDVKVYAPFRVEEK